MIRLLVPSAIMILIPTLIVGYMLLEAFEPHAPFKQALADAVLAQQIKRNVEYDFPVHFEEFKGIFASNIHMNWRGNPIFAEIRDKARFFDNNAFSTDFIIQFLVESAMIDPSLNIDENALLEAVLVNNDFKDRNTPDDVPLYSFWKQRRLFQDGKTSWYTSPINLREPIATFGTIERFLAEMLRFLGYGELADEFIELFSPFFTAAGSFGIPPDLDCSVVNWQMGSTLFMARGRYPSLYANWASENYGFENLVEKIVNVSYRPFSGDIAHDLLDPRQYFAIRGFLKSIPPKKLSTFMLPMTWIETFEENRALSERMISIPYNVNNLDASVIANFLFAIVANCIRQPVEAKYWLNSDIIAVINGSVMYIDYILRNNLLKSRPDLILPYYPSTLYYYFALSRSLHMLEAHNDSLPFSFLQGVYSTLGDVLRSIGTSSLLSYAKRDGEFVYFNGFLGDGDEEFGGDRIKRGEDRIFVTSCAINALLDIWTVDRTPGILSNGFVWLSDTPSEVKEVIQRAMSWAEKETFSGNFKASNTFFSSSTKGMASFPPLFPANYVKHINGSNLPENPTMEDYTGEVLVGVRGYIDEYTYGLMLNEVHFNFAKTEQRFYGYNSIFSTEAFPYWSSEPLTFATTLLAFTKYQALVE